MSIGYYLNGFLSRVTSLGICCDLSYYFLAFFDLTRKSFFNLSLRNLSNVFCPNFDFISNFFLLNVNNFCGWRVSFFSCRKSWKFQITNKNDLSFRFRVWEWNYVENSTTIMVPFDKINKISQRRLIVNRCKVTSDCCHCWIVLQT